MDDQELPSGHRDMDSVVADVRRRIAEAPIRIVSIDGWSGSGKPRLQRVLLSVSVSDGTNSMSTFVSDAEAFSNTSTTLDCQKS